MALDLLKVLCLQGRTAAQVASACNGRDAAFAGGTERRARSFG